MKVDTARASPAARPRTPVTAVALPTPEASEPPGLEDPAAFLNRELA